MQNELNIQEGSINQKSSNIMSVMLCTGAPFVKKISCLVAKIVLFDTACLHPILEVYPSKNIELHLSLRA